jgi:hypothetical protein
VRVLDAVVYPDLLEWLVVGCAVLVCVAILWVYLRDYLRRTAGASGDGKPEPPRMVKKLERAEIA